MVRIAGNRRHVRHRCPRSAGARLAVGLVAVGVEVAFEPVTGAAKGLSMRCSLRGMMPSVVGRERRPHPTPLPRGTAAPERGTNDHLCFYAEK